MSVRLYWNYHYEDARLEEVISRDPAEVLAVWGLTGENNVSVSDMSRFLTDQYEDIYEDLVNALVGRCWRFSRMHAEFQGEEFTDPTLVVRRGMLNVRLPANVQEQADAIVARCGDDKWELVNSLSDTSHEIARDEDYLTCLAWDIYRFRACERFGALIVPVEDYLEDTYWKGVRQRAKAASKVDLKQVGPDAFVANGSSGEHMVNTLRVTCTCPDFTNRGRKNGMHCKHLIAALRKGGLWEESWGAEIPKNKESIQTVSS